MISENTTPQTVEEYVTEAMGKKDDPIRLQNKQFWIQISQMCSNLSVLCDIGKKTSNPDSGCCTGYIEVNCDLLRDILATTLSHLDDMTTVIGERFIKNDECRNRSKRVCWLSYECYVYDDLLEPLAALYLRCYQSTIDSLEKHIPQLTISDLDMENSPIIATGKDFF